MAFPAGRDQRRDLGLGAGVHVGLAEVAAVRQQGLGRAQRLGKAGERFQRRLDLSLVVGGLDHVVGDHQQAVGRHQGLGVVGLFEAAAGHRHDARVRVGQIDLVLRPGPGHRRLGWTAARLAARLLGLLRARLELRLVLGPFPLKAFARPRLDHRLGLGDAGQTILAPGQFLGHRHPVGHIRPIGRLRQRHQLRHLGLQPGFELAGVFPRQRAVPARVGVHLGAVQRHRAELQHPGFPGQQQHLDEQPFDPGRENAAGTRRWYRGRDDRWPR